MRTPHRTLCVFFLAVFIVSPWSRGAWQAPKDKVMTEAQVIAYLQILKAALDDYRAAGNSANNAQSAAAAMAQLQQNNAKFQANLASHHMTEPEYSWIGERVMEAWGVILSSKVLSDATAGMTDQRNKIQQTVDDLKTKLAEYQKAQPSNRRVMSKDERQAAIDTAKNDQQSALDQAKQHDEEIKQFTDEAAKGDADAAKDAREKLDQAKKVRDAALVAADVAKKKMTDPDVPMTDDEKAEVKKQNEEMIASLSSQLTQAQSSLAQMDQAIAQFNKSLQDQQAKNPVPPQNVDLFKKHQSEFETAWGMKSSAK